MKKLLTSLVALSSVLALSSCGGSFMGSDELVIKNVYQEIGKNEKGEDGLFIIIEYDSDEKELDKFFIPNGKQGEIGLPGNGISKVDTQVNEETKETTITLHFTDSTVEPVSYVVPIGLSMTGVTNTKLENGDNQVEINFSDGSKSEPIVLPKGEKGDGFESYELTKNEDGSQVLVLNFSNHEPINIDIPVPEKGETGNGIKSIMSATIDEKFILQILYTDGETKQVEFDRPNTWLKGSEKPLNATGIDGDFFFDTLHKEIFTKEDGMWISVVKLDKETSKYVVTFNLNDSIEEPAGLPTGYTSTMNIKEGTYFGQQGNKPLPIPVRIGYEFDGWYLVKEPTAVNGRFTDTTPVYSDVTLYAKWVQA